jgi:hypothetical protein
VGKRESGPKWEASLWQSPTFVKNMLRSLTERAGRGDADATTTLARLLGDRPELKGLVRELDDLATKVEGVWARAAGLGNKLAEAAAQEEAARLKAELLGPDPTVLDRMLASNLVTSYLASQYASAVAARPSEVPAVTAVRDRRAESAQRRLIGAVKAWTLVRGKAAKGLAPPPGTALFETTPRRTESSDSPSESRDHAPPGPARDAGVPGQS